MESVRCPVVVGRDAEMAALLTALADATAARGGVVVLAGEAGIGKSRLLGELAGVARARGGLAVTGRAVESGTATPFRPLTEALLQALRVREPPAGGLGPWLAALCDVLPARAIGAAEPIAAAAEISPAMRGEAVLRLLRALAGPAGLLIGLEDLQWADPDTLAVVEYLAGNVQAERVLCVVTIRPELGSRADELVQALNARRDIRLLSLGRLSGAETGQMVAACRPSASPGEVHHVLDVADGVPFLVEELLAAPGVPPSFAAAVAARLDRLGEQERRVIQLAALLGRQFDWRLLPAAGKASPRVVASALEQAVGSLLLDPQGDTYQFRHALTREAIARSLLPHVRAELARAALAAVETAHPGLAGPSRDLAAELALQAGAADRAAQLFTESGRESLRRGALATAIATLQRAAGLAGPGPLRRTADALLVEALALAGRVDECLSVGAALLRMRPAVPSALAQTHLAVAHAAAEAGRWPVAADHLGSAERLLAEDPDPALTQRWRVGAAGTGLAVRDMAGARRLAELVLGSAAATAEVRCHALGLLGRSHRARDLDAARAAFSEALACAELADLPLWRLRAVHELGTIELFEQAGTDRLGQARRMATELGALSMAAVLDIQLAAACLFRFDPDTGERHAASALAASERLRLTQLRATALVFLAELAGLRRDVETMERMNSLALAAAPGDAEIAGSVWGGRGVAALLDDDEAGARRALQRAAECLAPLPNSGPGIYLGLWPLLLSVRADPRAAGAIVSARRTGMTVNRANRGMLHYAEAVLAGRRKPASDQAADLADRAAAELAHFPVWSDLARMLAAGPALADGWGQPRRWLASAARSFAGSGIEPLVQRCHTLLARPPPDRLSSLGITPREAEVLSLVSDGLSNRDIAARLFVSHRTVEKHVESLLRKTGARSRTQLAAVRAGVLGPDSR
jgi:DNA-binding CsgD family transcriptional regulator/energy-coupling factor transporter ATP-binding protein EcfA2